MNPEGRVFLGGSAAACTIRHSGAGTTIGPGEISVEPRYPGPEQRDIITPRMSSGRQRGAPLGRQPTRKVTHISRQSSALFKVLNKSQNRNDSPFGAFMASPGPWEQTRVTC
jgi:hypothetical protein